MKDNDAAATNLSPRGGGEDDCLDQTSRTIHEPRSKTTKTTNGDDHGDNESDEDINGDVVVVPTEDTSSTNGKKNDDDSNSALSLKINRRIAERVNVACQKAIANSNVLLSRTDLIVDVAMLRYEELEIGTKLGNGSFSDVHEITKITACDDDDNNNDGGLGKGDGGGGGGRVIDFRRDYSPGSFENKQVLNARTLLINHHKRGNGDCRYAVKFLREDVRASPEKYAIGTTDLVLEGMFLASLSHPNIIKVRGFPLGGVMSLCDECSPNINGYFLVLDRLYNTLADQIYKVWGNDHVVEVKKKFGFLISKTNMRDRDRNLAVRLKVAFDMSAALVYLHSKNLLYRDLKPENLGFDVRGDIKLFDLGLVKELHPTKKDKRGNYQLSMAGTPRYMAPEVALYQPYNLSADVYSFSMLLWEMVTLTKPFVDYSYSMLKRQVFHEGGRPSMAKVFNKNMSALICSGWSQNPKHRPSMEEVYGVLKSEYVKLAPHTTEREITHNRRRSTFVVRRPSERFK